MYRPSRDTRLARRYHIEAVKEARTEDREARVERAIVAEAHLLRHLGLWDGVGSCPSRVEEAVLLGAMGNADNLVQYAQRRIAEEGFTDFEAWVPLLRFLHSVVTDQTFDGSRRTYGYSRPLKQRCQTLLRDLLLAAVPDIPKKEKKGVPGLLGEYLDVLARVKEIRRRVKARQQTTFPEQDYRLLFDDLSAEFVRDLAVDDQGSRLKRQRGLGARGIAIRILAHRHKLAEHTVRLRVDEALRADEIAVSWKHREPRKARIATLARHLDQARRSP